jgi:hypothetical protein
VQYILKAIREEEKKRRRKRRRKKEGRKREFNTAHELKDNSFWGVTLGCAIVDDIII